MAAVDGRTLRRIGTALAAIVIAGLVAWLGPGDGLPGDSGASGSSSSSVSSSDPGSGSDSGSGDSADGAVVDEADLPPEARETLELIDAGGPFPYDKDGSTFGNYEGLLPEQPRGYYAEYTVPTPGEDDRGARRIVVGDGGEMYWTDDHYESFERIRRD